MNDTRPQQYPGYPDYPPYIEEDEIKLLDYVIVLLKYKWLIFGIVFATGVAAVIISLMLPNIYRSEATIIPRQQEKSAASSALSALGAISGMAGELVGLGGGGDVDKFEVVLKSRDLARRVVEKYKLIPELFEDEWDPLKKEWKENPAPTIQDAYKFLMGMLTVSRDKRTDVLTIKFDHEDPNFAKILVDNYLIEAPELTDAILYRSGPLLNRFDLRVSVTLHVAYDLWPGTVSPYNVSI